AVGGAYVGLSFVKLLQFSALLNVNLAVFNLLPILPLDRKNRDGSNAENLPAIAKIGIAFDSWRLGLAAGADTLCHRAGHIPRCPWNVRMIQSRRRTRRRTRTAAVLRFGCPGFSDAGFAASVRLPGDP